MNKAALAILNLLGGPRKSGRLMLFVLGFLSFFIQAPSPIQAAATIDLSSGYFGNQAVVDDTVGQVALTINGSKDVQVSMRFYQPDDDVITGFVFHGSVIGGASCDYSVYSDVGGIPGTILGGDNNGFNSGWKNVGFTGSGVTVYADNIYHIVIDGGGIAGNYYLMDAYTSPLHYFHALDQSMDGEMDTTLDRGDGNGFQSLGVQPVGIILYDSGVTNTIGNPYTTTNPIPVYGTRVVGEEFVAPSTSPWVSKVGAFLKKTGAPNGGLAYDLDDLTGGSPVTGSMATTLTASASFAWADVPLAGGPIQLTGGHRYRLSFSAVESTSSAYYIVDNPTDPEANALYDELTFDGTNAYTVLSTNGGASFPTTYVNSDLAFRLLISSAPTATPTMTSTRTATRTPTRTATPTMTPTSTATASLSPTSTATRTSTLTATPINTFTPNPAWTPPCAPSNGTFGNTTNGITDSGQTDNDIWATRYTLSEAATITSMAVYLDYQSGSNPLVQTAIYTDNAGSPGNLIVSSPSQTLFTIWNYLTVPATVLAPGTYWLSYQATSGTGTLSRRSTYPTAQDSISVYSPYGAFPSIFPSGYASWSEHICIYAVYCPVTPYTPIVTMTATPTITSTPTVTNTWTSSATMTNTLVPTATDSPTITSTPSLTPQGVPYTSYCPGFGATSPGGPESPSTTSSIRAAKYTLSAAAAVTAVSFYMDFSQAPTSSAVRVGIYSHDSNQSKPNNLMTQSGYILNVLQQGWNTIPVTMTVLTPGEYWMSASVYVSGVSYDWWGTVEAGGVSVSTGDWTSSAPQPFTAAVYPTSFHYDFHALCGPMPTSTPTLTQTSTQTFSPTSTATDTPSSTLTSTSTVTATSTPSFTSTDSPTASPTPTWTSTWTPMDTSTSTPTDSSTASPTSTWTVTDTFTSVWTPTATGTPTLANTPTNTRTLSPTPMASATWTATLDPTSTWTITQTPINTSTPINTATPFMTATSTWTAAIATATPIPSSTPDGSYNLSSNVFRPSQSLMNVDYAVGKPGHTTVKVFNVAGELVRSLVDQDLGQGVQRVLWDGRNRSGNLVGSGFYLIKIETPSASKTLRVIVRR